MEFEMSVPQWIKPGLLGVGVGAIAITVTGFGWGGWMTTGKANSLASEQARSEVVSAIIPYCIERYEADPNKESLTENMEKASSYERTEIIMESGWAQAPGESSSDRNIARACAEKIVSTL